MLPARRTLLSWLAVLYCACGTSSPPATTREVAEAKGIGAGDASVLQTEAAVSPTKAPPPPPTPPPPEPDHESVLAAARELVRETLDAVEVGEVLPVERGSEPLVATGAVLRFYEARAYVPAWYDGTGIRPIARELLSMLEGAAEDGLAPANYHARELGKRFAAAANAPAPDPEQIAMLDLLLSDAFLLFADHMLTGKVVPEQIHAKWHAEPRERDLVELLDRAVDGDSLAPTFDVLRPRYPDYGRLRRVLAGYREIAAGGGWGTVPGDKALRKGDMGPRVVALRKRLAATKDLASIDEEDAPFDDAVEAAVRVFQRRHGIGETGEVDAGTLAALAVPVEKRIEELVLNLERWRWLPDELGARHVLVNIPEFELRAIEGEDVKLRMRVQVGRDYRRTPTFSDEIRHLVFNPYWNVPRSIATRDILPNARRNPGYLRARNIRVFNGWGADAIEIPANRLPWRRLSARNFPYRLRQDPGPQNALGRVTFMFPNSHAVYLHDTPSRNLFDEDQRGFSSGCVRVEKPLELAEWLLGGGPTWTIAAMQPVIARGRPRTVRLRQRVPVHLLYFTAWADDTGLVHFRRDVYARDGKLSAALREHAPGAQAR